MKRRLITRRNLIRAGVAAPFALPKYAEALSQEVKLAVLGGAGPVWVPGMRPFSASSPANTPLPANSIYAPLNWPAATGGNFFTSVKFYFDTGGSNPVAVAASASWNWPAATINENMTPGFAGINQILSNGDLDNEAVSIDGNVSKNWYDLNVSGNAATAPDYALDNLLSGTGFGGGPTFTPGSSGGKGAGIVAAGSNLMMGALTKEEFTQQGGWNHLIAFEMISSLCNNQSPNFYEPAISGDGSSGNGLFCEGQIMAIPKTTSMPSGLSVYGQALFLSLQNYGAFCMDTGGSCGPYLARWYKNVGGSVDPQWASPTSWKSADIIALQADMPKIFPLLYKTGYLFDGYLFTAAPFQACSPQLQLQRYAGNLMTVTRDSDSTSLAIGQTGAPAGLLNTTALTAFCSGTIGRVSTFDDQIQNRNYVSAGSSAPIIYQSGALETINDKPSILFDGTTNYLQSNTPFPGGGIYLNAVVQPTDFAGNYAIFGSSASGGLEVRLNETTGAVQLMTNTGTVIATTATSFALGLPALIEVSYTPGTSYSIWINRANVLSGSTAVSAVMTGEILIGSGGPTTADLFKGLISAWDVCQGISSNAQYTISGYLAQFYAPLAAETGDLLDLMSVPASVAYSTRKLRSAYAGSALRVQRSSDSTQLDIGFASNGQLDTTTMLSFVGAGTGTVVTWYDQSGNAINASAGTQPRIVNAGVLETLNGNAAIRFGASSTTNLLYTLSLAQPDTIAIALQRNANVANGHFTDGNTSSPRQLVGVGSGTYQLYAGTSPLTGGVDDFNPHGILGIFNGASSLMSVDGVTVIGGNPGTNGIGFQSIGSGDLAGGGVAMSGWIGDYIVFGSVLDSTDQATLQANWQTQWGTP